MSRAEMQLEVPHTPEQRSNMASSTGFLWLGLFLVGLGVITLSLSFVEDFNIDFIDTSLEKAFLGTFVILLGLASAIIGTHKGGDAHM